MAILYINIYLHRKYHKTSFICCLIVTAKNLISPVVFIFLFMVTSIGIFICSTVTCILSLLKTYMGKENLLHQTFSFLHYIFINIYIYIYSLATTNFISKWSMYSKLCRCWATVKVHFSLKELMYQSNKTDKQGSPEMKSFYLINFDYITI